MPRKQPVKALYPVMSKEEYRQARGQYVMPLPVFCDMLGISWRQEIRYRKGHSPIPDPVARLLRTIVRHGIDPDEVG